jgi:broad specificity phosphatase PhoE
VSVVRVLLVRHPETEANAERRYVGRGDTALTEQGREQAAALVGRVLAWDPYVVVSSPSERCLIVARRVAEGAGVPCEIRDALAEMDFGLAEGLTYEEALRAGVSIDLLGGPSPAPFDGGEAWDVFAARVAEAAAGIERAGERVAVVTHSGVIRALLTHWLALPDEAAWRFAVPTAGMADVAVEDGHGVLISFGA